jgi:predicted nuclease with TOPRIM domain
MLLQDDKKIYTYLELCKENDMLRMSIKDLQKENEKTATDLSELEAQYYCKFYDFPTYTTVCNENKRLNYQVEQLKNEISKLQGRLRDVMDEY